MAFANIYAGMKFDKTKLAKTSLFETDHIQFGGLFLEPGQSQDSHKHDHSDKVLFVMEGVATVTVGHETMELGPGACALAKSGEHHALSNKGRDRVVMLVISAPPAKKA